MGLIQALQTSISALNLNQQQLDTLSQNIANANTAGYSNEVVNQKADFINGQGVGVSISSIARTVSAYLTSQVQSQTSTNGAASAIQGYYADIENLLGTPGSTTNPSIDQNIDAFFAAVQNMANSPSSESQTVAVNAGNTMAGQISSLASSLYGLQLQSDNDISSAVSSVNADLKNLQGINTALEQATATSQPTGGLLDQRDAALTDISKYLSISPSYGSDGEVTINTAGGTTLLTPNTLGQLSYRPASGTSTFINNNSLAAIQVSTINSDGTTLGAPVNLTTSGTASSITSSISGGSLQGLLSIRDGVIPNIISQLNSLASNISTKINAITNAGTSYPPPHSYTGTRAVNASTLSQYSGSVRIAVLNSTGGAIPSPYADEPNGLQPLTLNLGALNYGNGNGNLSLNNIVDSFNQYYGTPQNKLEIGNLNNVQLSMGSDSVTGGVNSTMSFGFNLNNISGSSSTATISNAQIFVGDPTNGISAGTVTGSSTNTVATGSTDNTGNGFTATFNNSASAATYFTVQADMTVDGHTSTVSYRIPNNTSNVDNNLIGATSQTGSGTIVVPTSTAPIATAELVDANGNPLVETNGSYGNQTGYLKITADNTSQTIAIGQIDSNETASGEGFSQFFGLNNFFTDNSPTSSNGISASGALNLSVNSNILNDPSLLSTATLTAGNPPANTADAPNYTYVINSGDSSISQQLAALSTSSVSFGAAGGLPDTSTTLAQYAGQIIAGISTNSSNATNSATDSQTLLSGFTSRATAVSGVNLDQELANTQIYQNAYSASARVITVIGELFTALISIIQ